jgi:hypothetical protein
MNTTFKFRALACSGLFLVFVSLAHAETSYVVTDGNKKATRSFTADATPPLDPVPEPSGISLILLGLGGVGLALKLRKRAA